MMLTRSCLLAWILPLLLVGPGTEPGSERKAAGVEILRDAWGIPHIFAKDDQGAFRGLGYATAEDRGFQMHYLLRIIQGRLAETIGDVGHVRRRDTALLSDRRMRTFGFYRAAERLVPKLDEETRSLLQAYCDGVNSWFEDHTEPGSRHPLFARLGLVPAPWTPADCIASWWHMAQFFATDGTRDLLAWRNRDGANRRRNPKWREIEALRKTIQLLSPDDSTAVVRKEDVDPKWIGEIHRWLASQGYTQARKEREGEKGNKFSHAWVVGGMKSSTGSTLLVSDPQTPVTNPSLFYEFHIQGASFNARGIGVPGSPILLIGFTDKVAWGVTALGADQADLFRLETDAEHTDQYRFDGKWRKMQVRKEVIRIKGDRDRTIRVRETHLGPVITPFAFARPEDGEVAVRRIPIAETDRETIQGAIAMLRAKDAKSFGKALAGWRFPSVNMLYGDREGHIGYWTQAAMPLRSPLAKMGGRQALPGNQSAYAWRGIVPHDLMPHVEDPSDGYLFSGNHRPVGSFYPIYLGNMTGSQGDGIRSWRLRERLSARKTFTPEQVFDIHYDMCNPARRELVHLGLAMRRTRDLSMGTLLCLDELTNWYQKGCPSDLRVRGSALALEIPLMFRIVNTPLTLRYGGGLSGLSRFLKTMKRELDAGREKQISDQVAAYVDEVLAQAWESATRKYGQDTSRWQAKAREALARRRLGYYRTLDGYPALDPALAMAMPALYCIDGTTVHSQLSQSYTQFVNLADVDSSRSILPPGQSERPDSPTRTSTQKLWSQGALHPAPLSRKAVEAITVSRTRLR